MNERKDLPKSEPRPTQGSPLTQGRADEAVVLLHVRSLLQATKRDAYVRLEAAAKKRDHTSISSST